MLDSKGNNGRSTSMAQKTSACNFQECLHVEFLEEQETQKGTGL